MYSALPDHPSLNHFQLVGTQTWSNRRHRRQWLASQHSRMRHDRAASLTASYIHLSHTLTHFNALPRPAYTSTGQQCQLPWSPLRLALTATLRARIVSLRTIRSSSVRPLRTRSAVPCHGTMYRDPRNSSCVRPSNILVVIALCWRCGSPSGLNPNPTHRTKAHWENALKVSRPY